MASMPQYEELGIKNRSLTQTPKYFDQTQETLSTVKKVPLQTGPSAFVSYRQAVLDTLDQQTPRTRSRAREVSVRNYCSAHGTWNNTRREFL